MLDMFAIEAKVHVHTGALRFFLGRTTHLSFRNAEAHLTQVMTQGKPWRVSTTLNARHHIHQVSYQPEGHGEAYWYLEDLGPL